MLLCWIRENETYQICIRLLRLALLLGVRLQFGGNAAFVDGFSPGGVIERAAGGWVEQVVCVEIERHIAILAANKKPH